MIPQWVPPGVQAKQGDREMWSVPFFGIFDGFILVGMEFIHRIVNRFDHLLPG
jgi:hypothetical protein